MSSIPHCSRSSSSTPPPIPDPFLPLPLLRQEGNEEDEEEENVQSPQISSSTTITTNASRRFDVDDVDVDVIDTTALLNLDSLAIIFSYLDWYQILQIQIVCTKWKEAVPLVPCIRITIHNRNEASRLNSISKILSNTQSFVIDFGNSNTRCFDIQKGHTTAGFGGEEVEGGNGDGGIVVVEGNRRVVNGNRHRGHDASIENNNNNHNNAAAAAAPAPIDISYISNFQNLKVLKLRHAHLNGYYPFLFQSFTCLEHLDLTWHRHLQWDLQMLIGLPNLVRLYCPNNKSLTGDLSDIKKYLSKTKFQELVLSHCINVTGKFQDLFEFTALTRIILDDTPQIIGDIRDIGTNDLPSIQELKLGEGGIDGGGDFQFVSDAPSLMLARYHLVKHRCSTIFNKRRWRLSDTSPDHYQVYCHRSRKPPFLVEFVDIAGRIGWRWTNGVEGGACEIHWIDPEPSSSSSQRGDNDDVDIHNNKVVSVQQQQVLYKKALREDHQMHVRFFKGFWNPPTRMEYDILDRTIPLDRRIARATRIPTSWTIW